MCAKFWAQIPGFKINCIALFGFWVGGNALAYMPTNPMVFGACRPGFGTGLCQLAVVGTFAFDAGKALIQGEITVPPLQTLTRGSSAFTTGPEVSGLRTTGAVYKSFSPAEGDDVGLKRPDLVVSTNKQEAAPAQALEAETDNPEEERGPKEEAGLCGRVPALGWPLGHECLGWSFMEKDGEALRN
jgi:hypothetical protein